MRFYLMHDELSTVMHTRGLNTSLASHAPFTG